jgi:N-acyl-L-homoserine lactone synthetase
MIKVVTGVERDDINPVLLPMFRERKRVFIDLLRWGLPPTAGDLELDEFDGAGAIYFISSDQDGNHLGSLRLLRSDGPHLLGAQFPELCNGAVPRAAGIVEVSRLCLSPRSAAGRLHVRNQLISGLVDYALDHDLSALTGVVTTCFLSQILQMGWKCERLGPALRFEGAELAGFIIHLDGQTRDGLARTGVYVAPERSADLIGPVREAPSRLSINGRDVLQIRQRLRADGAVLVPDLLPDEIVNALNEELGERFAKTPFCQGNFYGPRTKRFGALLRRSATAANFVQHPLILGIVETVLGPACDCFNLNLTQAIELHPGAPAQFPHQ